MERDLVQWLRETLPPHPQVKIGVGDDAAVVGLGQATDLVVTTDLLADGVHFLAEEAEPALIGRKCLAANLSDLAAMAAEPVAVVVSLLLPSRGGGRPAPDGLARGLIEGMLPLAEEFGVAIAGGDTNTWKGELALSVTAFGRPGPHGLLTRSGAKAGDRLLVTGELGGSIEGHHLAFSPRVREALQLKQHYSLHAGMDLTDGLAIDLSRLCEASGVGAVIRADCVPASPSAERLALASGGEALSHALSDGEDFELLLAAPPDSADAMLKDQPLACGLTEIGRVIDAGLWLEGAAGDRQPLAAVGYEHH